MSLIAILPVPKMIALGGVATGSMNAREAARVRADARQHAMDERQSALDQARARADERLLGVLDTLEKDAETARSDLRARAEDLARLLASRLLGRELG